MHSGNGYVIVDITIKEFPAHIVMQARPEELYVVTITFGGKVVYFDPINGRTPSSNTVEGVVKLLRGRCDLANREEVIEEFLSKARILLARMSEDNITPPNK